MALRWGGVPGRGNHRCSCKGLEAGLSILLQALSPCFTRPSELTQGQVNKPASSRIITVAGTIIKGSLAPLFQMSKLRPREDERSQHNQEAGGIRFILGPMVSSTYTCAMPTGGWASLGSGKEDAGTKCTEGEAWTWDVGSMGGVGSGIEAMTRMPPGL